MPIAVRIAHGVMGVVFALSVVLQFNDPDPLAWIVLYSFAAAAAFLATFRKYPCAQILGGIVFVVSLISLVPYVRGRAWTTGVDELTKEWQMNSEAIVDGREFYALLWIIVWMIVVFITSRLALKKSGPPAAT
jgi:uncharacterized membrane protein